MNIKFNDPLTHVSSSRFCQKYETFLLTLIRRVCLWIQTISRCCLDFQKRVEFKFTPVSCYNNGRRSRGAFPSSFGRTYPVVPTKTPSKSWFQMAFQNLDLSANQYDLLSSYYPKITNGQFRYGREEGRKKRIYQRRCLVLVRKWKHK